MWNNFPKPKSEFHFKRYQKFIESRKLRKLKENEYTEKHHILPKSLDGSNEGFNLIKLNAKEHYIAHLILWKAFGGKMIAAFWIISNINKHNITSKQYEKLKTEHSKNLSKKMKGKHLSEKTKNKISKNRKGRSYIEQFGEENANKLKEKMSMSQQKRVKSKNYKNSMKGKKHSEEAKKRIGESAKITSKGSKNGMYGRKLSKEHRKAISDKNKRTRIIKKDKEIIVVPIEELSNYLNRGWVLGVITGKILINKNKINKVIEKNELEKYLNNGWLKGCFKDISDEYKEKMMYHRKYNDNFGTKGKIAINNGKITKMVKKEKLQEYFDRGWIKGNLSLKNNKGAIGKIWINNDVIEKYAEKSDIDNYLNNGWKKGRLKRKNKWQL